MDWKKLSEFKCDEKKIHCTTYVSGYNQYSQEIFDEKSQLYKFSPDITFLIIDSRNALGELFLNPYSVSVEEKKTICAKTNLTK